MIKMAKMMKITKTLKTQKYSLATTFSTRCGAEKQESGFSKSKAAKDGFQNYCKTCSKTYLSEWQNENREHYNAYFRNRYRNNENHRLAKLNRVRIYQTVKKTPHDKASSRLASLVLLGAPISVVNLWLDFTGNYTTRSGLMHIDHFIPCAKFDLSDPEQQKECLSYMNLRIIPASENLSKNAKLPTKSEYINHINMS